MGLPCGMLCNVVPFLVSMQFPIVCVGNPMFQMLDAMLAMYIDLPSRMNPGVSALLHCAIYSDPSCCCCCYQGLSCVI